MIGQIRSPNATVIFVRFGPFALPSELTSAIKDKVASIKKYNEIGQMPARPFICHFSGILQGFPLFFLRM